MRSTTCSPRRSSARRSAPQRPCSFDAAHPGCDRSRPSCAALGGPDGARSRRARRGRSGRASTAVTSSTESRWIGSNTMSGSPSAMRASGSTGSSSTSFATFARRSAASGAGSGSSTTRNAGRTALRAAGLVGAAIVLVALLPKAAYAWTPGTHVFLGEAVLARLAQLPKAIADLLRAFPYDFLYGSIAADTSIAKKYAPDGRHCHSWAVGLEIHEAARRRAAAGVRARLPRPPRRRRGRAQLLRADAARP